MTAAVPFDDDPEHLITLACLYRAVLDRPPDRVGLANYGDQLRRGKPLSGIARSVTRSREARTKLGTRAAADFYCLNLLGRPAEEAERALSPAELAVALVSNPEVRRRQDIVGALFPGGIPIGEQSIYPWWLKQRRNERSRRYQPREWQARAPLLSVMIIAEDVEPAAFAATLASLENQVDRRFELMVVAREGHGSKLPETLGQAVRRLVLPHWWSERALLRDGLDHCAGRFAMWARAGDRLDPGLVAEIALAEVEADVLLADEDRATPDGGSEDPTFGPPAWDPDLALQQAPRGLLLVRTHVARAGGGWRPTVDDEQDWDLVLRLSRMVPPARIRRLPAVLLHRAAGSAATPALTARQAAEARVRAHLDALQEQDCVVLTGESGLLRIVYPLPATPPLVSIIIPTRDRATLLAACLDGLMHRTTYPDIEILIIDNDSREAETAALFAKLGSDPRVRILPSPGPFNWSALNNQGVAAMRGSVAVLLNNDTEVTDPAWLSELVRQVLRPEVGLASAKLLYPDGTVQHAGITLAHGHAVHTWRHAPGTSSGYANQLRTVRTVSAATGACLALRRAVFDEVGGLEQQNLAVTWSDIDLCFRVRQAGYRIVWTPHAVLTHVELATRGSDEPPEAAARMSRERAYIVSRWNDTLDRDPCFSPNLEPTQSTPHLAGFARWP